MKQKTEFNKNGEIFIILIEWWSVAFLGRPSLDQLVWLSFDYSGQCLSYDVEDQQQLRKFIEKNAYHWLAELSHGNCNSPNLQEIKIYLLIYYNTKKTTCFLRVRILVCSNKSCVCDII